MELLRHEIEDVGNFIKDGTHLHSSPWKASEFGHHCK